MSISSICNRVLRSFARPSVYAAIGAMSMAGCKVQKPSCSTVKLSGVVLSAETVPPKEVADINNIRWEGQMLFQIHSAHFDNDCIPTEKTSAAFAEGIPRQYQLNAANWLALAHFSPLKEPKPILTVSVSFDKPENEFDHDVEGETVVGIANGNRLAGDAGVKPQ